MIKMVQLLNCSRLARSWLSRSVSLSQRYNWSVRSSTSVATSTRSQLNSYKINDSIHGFRLKKIEDVPELSLSAYYLHHEATGAKHLHLQRDDSNNVFSVSLRTKPHDDTGVAHILEHLALCGSINYPCRDPFMKMLNRSLATFMNAMTWPDCTMYPFATQNQADFENLMKIYLDAVFFPRLRPVDFRQEGWRLEHSDVNDPKSPIVLKGVVFNEMKGAFSSSSMLFMRSLLNQLFTNEYKHESGGDPISIPCLSHQQLLDFHAKYYHPSNSRFFTYGNFPLDSHLALINNYVLEKFKHNSICENESRFEEQMRWSKPIVRTIECQPDPLAAFPDKQTTVAVAYLINNVTDIQESFTMSILCHLLIDGPNSPFYKSLLTSDLGSDYSPTSGFSEYLKQSAFSIGLQGIHSNDVDKVRNIIQSTFESVANEGFPEERIEAVLHSVELAMKHQSDNFGIGLAMSLNPIFNHDGDPVEMLEVNKHVSYFRDEISKNPNFLKDKVKQYFLNNNHRLTLIMNSSPNFETSRMEKESSLLNKMVTGLNDSDKETIYKDGLELLNVQKEVEDNSILPTLNIKKDISLEVARSNTESVTISNIPLQLSCQPTNGVTYFRCISKITQADLPNELKPYLPIFCDVVTKLSAGKRNHMEMNQEIQLRTGGLSAAVHVAQDLTHCDLYEHGVSFYSHSLERNFDNMMSLWSDIFTGAKFDDDKQHLAQLIKIASADVSQSVVMDGHRYAMRRASANVSNASNFNEVVSGLSFVSSLKKEAESEDVEQLITNLKRIGELVFRRDNLKCALNAEAPAIRTSVPVIEKFIQRLPGSGRISPNLPVELPMGYSTSSEHHVLPIACNYIGKAYYSIPFIHDDHPKLKIASKLLSAKYLLREVREKGGAYGSGSVLTNGGVFTFFSYRDPNVAQTLESFDDSVKWLKDSSNYSTQDIDEAKLSTFQEIDKPVTAGNKGKDLFTLGLTDDMKKEYRIKLLNVTAEDTSEVAQRYLLPSIKNSSVAVIGPECEFTKNKSNWKLL